jgi:lipopolysaccharide/colanic/teichoic acid biosynthesis glycosyltransferase
MPQTPSSLSESFIRRARESPRRAGVDTALRTLDVALSLLFLAIAAIPMLVIAAAILVSSGRPILYRGRRVGRGGQFYTMLKFRTLAAGAEERLGPFLGPELVEKTREERTRVGRWLRATQLDELPQLFNVLRGDMSLVGPRPLLMEYLGRYTPAQQRRHDVRPGITGLAQVNGLRGDTSIDERAVFDNNYIENWSLWKDVVILFRTIGAVLTGAGY